VPSIQPLLRKPLRHASRIIGACSKKMPKHPIRRGVPWARKIRGETSSAAVAAMNSRRFIRSSSQLEETGADYQVSMVVALRTYANAASQTRRVAQDSYGSIATV
jgi:hypothetical protein